MEKKELIMSVLEKMGYSPEIDKDGDILFHYQMKTIYVMMEDGEESYLSMMLLQFYEIEEGEETAVLAVCNKMNRELKVAKIYVDQTFKNVTATWEFFVANEEALEMNIRKSLRFLSVVRTVFRENLLDLTSE